MDEKTKEERERQGTGSVGAHALTDYTNTRRASIRPDQGKKAQGVRVAGRKAAHAVPETFRKEEETEKDRGIFNAMKVLWSVPSRKHTHMPTRNTNVMTNTRNNGKKKKEQAREH